MNLTEKADQEAYELQRAIAERQPELDRLTIEAACREEWDSSKSVRDEFFSFEGYCAYSLDVHKQRLADAARRIRNWQRHQ